MSIINVLDKSVYNRISAGEVVESPFSVVKELVENAVDALATSITINIFRGGKDFIEVIDNGVGIGKDDMLKTVLPHATSKIKTADDLDKIKTLGFRGEALASIASVSRVNITSRTLETETGYTFDCVGGECSELTEKITSVGTKITVSDLFFNTPARLKFLKSDKSEENAITDMVSRMILANPTVNFKYTVDGKTVLSSYGDGIDDAVLAVYGVEAVENSFKISNYKNGIQIDGYIGNHNYTKANRTSQTVILNGRYIVNQTISTAIFNAYSSYLMKRRYPFYVLYIKMPPEFVDVNVTPNKSDVRFVDNSVVYSAIYSTVSNVLDGTDKAVNIIVDNKKKEEDEYTLVTLTDKPNVNKKYTKDDFKSTNFGNILLNLAENPLKFNDLPQPPEKAPESSENAVSIDIFAENKRYIQELEEKKRREEELLEAEDESGELKYIAQILNTYLIFERGNNVYFIDQHAAHERLLYNKLCYLRMTGEKEIQPLLVPFDLTVNPLEYDYVYEKLSYIQSLGIEIIENNRGGFSVTAVPCELLSMNLNEFFKELLTDASFMKETIPNVINEKLMQKACKSAVKSGKKMSDSEVEALMRLLNGNIDLKCPHGRPIAVKIQRKEIDKWFKRIV
ncbi:MAG: DNA mismatch repair endonuclease MutL [Clostridia bacterium]|nr:DNA mismatch repair endonuclease MutL [Clostridia bacterium]